MKSIIHLLIFFGTIFYAHAASAGLKLCNETDGMRSFAIAYSTGEAWQSEGWWNVDSGSCKTVVGGDLKQRYYYYRATREGNAVNSGDYYFCTQSEPFTIVGDEDCTDRGYKRENFDVIDTGTSATSFTFTLTGAAKQTEAAKTEGWLHAESEAGEPGLYGEPYTVIGVMQGCDIIDGLELCAFHADGWKWVTYFDMGTTDTTMQEMERLEIGSLFVFRGDIISYGDITVEMVVHNFRPALADKFDTTRKAMQGSWQSLQDSASVIEILGSEKRDYVSSEYHGSEYLVWAESCPGSTGDSIHIIATNPEMRDDPLCFAVIDVDPRKLTLLYVGGNGQFLEYKRAE